MGGLLPRLSAMVRMANIACVVKMMSAWSAATCSRVYSTHSSSSDWADRHASLMGKSRPAATVRRSSMRPEVGTPRVAPRLACRHPGIEPLLHRGAGVVHEQLCDGRWACKLLLPDKQRVARLAGSTLQLLELAQQVHHRCDRRRGDHDGAVGPWS